MRVVVLSDSHIDHGVHGFDAHDAWRNATEWVLEHGAELVVVAGDMFHTGRSGGVSLNLAGDSFVSWGKADIPVVVLVGNHEWIGARPAATGKCLPVEAFDGYSKVRVVRKPRLIKVPNSDLAVAAMPWPEPGQGAEHVEAAAGRLAEKCEQHDGPRIAVAHAAVEGASVKTLRGSEIDLWRFASEPVVSLDAIDVPEAFGHTALGHVHRRQSLSDTCSYVGSTEAMGFSDQNMLKGFSSFEWDDTAGRWDEVFVEAGVRRFLTLDVMPGCEGIEDQMLEMEPGTLVRLRFGDGADSGDASAARASVKEGGGSVIARIDASTDRGSGDDPEEWLEEADDETLAHFDMTLEELMERYCEHVNVPESDRAPVTAMTMSLQDEIVA